MSENELNKLKKEMTIAEEKMAQLTTALENLQRDIILLVEQCKRAIEVSEFKGEQVEE